MKISNKIISTVISGLILCSCSSQGPIDQIISSSLIINNRPVYLRGEMNDYEVSETYRLRKSDDGFCTYATLRTDWSPYKFKFADANWSEGSNFGFMSGPGVIREGALPLKLNPYSKFEEISFYPNSDGAYKFCVIKRKDGYYVTVQKSNKKRLLSMAQLFKLSKE